MRIGNVEISGNAALAPMAGVADRAFREICTDFGASYVVTEMVSSKGISYNSEKSAQLMVVENSPCPAAVQLFGDEPETLAYAAKFAMKYSPDIIDINMGCPAPKISGNGSGSALMKNPKLCGEIVSAVKNAVGIPVTVKIRKGWDNDSVNALEVAKYCEDNGADALTIHGRTREQFYSGKADWDIIAQVKEALSIPVIGNGDIIDAKSAAAMYEQTNCDYIMVGRGALGNPWIFRQINAWFDRDTFIVPPSIDERLSVMFRHIKLACEYKGERVGIREARKHIAWYLKGFHGAAAFRGEAGRVNTLGDVEKLIYRVRCEALKHGL
ncbi:MAG: tRNA dihydrouridine synthase DusB [Acutalibacteraceae bacterium]